jgi:hypothetical protein
MSASISCCNCWLASAHFGWHLCDVFHRKHPRNRFAFLRVSSLTVNHKLFDADRLKLFAVNADNSVQQLMANDVGSMLELEAISGDVTKKSLVTVTQHERVRQLSNIHFHVIAKSNESLVPVFFTLQCAPTLHVSLFFHPCLILESRDLRRLQTQVTVRMLQLERARVMFLLSSVVLPNEPTLTWLSSDPDGATVMSNDDELATAARARRVRSTSVSHDALVLGTSVGVSAVWQSNVVPTSDLPLLGEHESDSQLEILASVALRRVTLVAARALKQ